MSENLRRLPLSVVAVLLCLLQTLTKHTTGQLIIVGSEVFEGFRDYVKTLGPLAADCAGLQCMFSCSAPHTLELAYVRTYIDL